MLFALLPPDDRGWEFLNLFLLAALLLGGVLALALGLAMKRWPAPLRLALGVASVVQLGLLLYFLMPSVARVPRYYSAGHDQFYWAGRAHSTVPEERREAATALASLLQSDKQGARTWAIQYLGDCEPTERDIAPDALLAVARTEGEPYASGESRS